MKSNSTLPPRIDAFLAEETALRAVFDISGTLVAANAAFYRRFERSPEQMNARPFWDFIDPASLDATFAVLDHLSMSGDIEDFVNCYLTPTGDPLWLNWHCDRAGDDGLLYAECTQVPAPGP